MSLGIAFRAFFKSLFDADASQRVAEALALAETQPRLGTPSPAQEPVKEAKPPEQNAAITLLAALQRDSRLIDLIYEDLDQYQDAQVGAAARPCLKQCRSALDRLLKISPVMSSKEGDAIELSGSESSGRLRFVGDGDSNTKTAKLVHPGWQSIAIELPKSTAAEADHLVIAPAQVSAP